MRQLHLCSYMMQRGIHQAQTTRLMLWLDEVTVNGMSLLRPLHIKIFNYSPKPGQVTNLLIGKYTQGPEGL